VNEVVRRYFPDDSNGGLAPKAHVSRYRPDLTLQTTGQQTEQGHEMNVDLTSENADSASEVASSAEALCPFHLAIPVRDLSQSREFYGELFGCPEGRSDTTWVDFDFFGHQLVCHVDHEASDRAVENPVDGHSVPIPHFGIVLDIKRWSELAERLKSHNVKFVIEPYIRFEGQPGEQGTMFLEDPSGNAVEFKGFRDRSSLFAK
jgi:extradiol dioxygenase family protein